MFSRLYSSVSEMVAACDQADKRGRNVAATGRASFTGRSDLATWKDVVEKAVQPWEQGLDVVQEMLHELRDLEQACPPKSVRRKARWSPDDGDEIDIDRVRSGQDPWRQTRREQQRGPQTITVVAHVGALCNVSHDDILWRGAAAIVLADLLEKAGYRVELWSASQTTQTYENGEGSFNAVRLKDAGEPLDISNVVNGIAGWFLRTVVFQSRAVHTVRIPGTSVGATKAISIDDEPIREIVGNSRSVIIDGVWSKAAATAFVRRTIATLDN